MNKTSMIQATTSAHTVHIHRKAAADWVGELRRCKQDARQRYSFEEGVAGSMKRQVGVGEGQGQCCPALSVRESSLNT